MVYDYDKTVTNGNRGAKEMTQELRETIRFVATELDRELLEQLAQLEGDASMSATMRKLIRREAQRRGLLAITTPAPETPEPELVK